MSRIIPISLKQIDEIALSGFVNSVISGTAPSIVYDILFSGGYLGDNVVYASGGDQVISGQKSFELSPNIPYSGGTGQAVSLQFVLDAIQAAAPSSGVTIEYLNSLGIVYTTGTQTIIGNKTFTGDINVKLATSSQNAVPLYQLVSVSGDLSNKIRDTGIALDTRVRALEVSDGAEGFAGVSSFNAQSGNIFVQGLGNVQVFQDGNITYISGGGAGSGIQGSMGPYLKYRGDWNTGQVYSYLDWVSIDGNSWASLTGHLSDETNEPGLNNYWALLASGKTGPAGADGTGIQGEKGEKGDSSILFTWRGNWLPDTVYQSGDAVYLSGSSYGFTGVSASGIGQNPLNYAGWDIVVQGETIDTSQFYPRNNPSGYVTINHNHNYLTGISVGGATLTGVVNMLGGGNTTVSRSGQSIVITSVGGGGGGGTGISQSFIWRDSWIPTEIYNSGDAVGFNNAIYFYTSDVSITGINNSPISVNGSWERFGERSISFNTGSFNPNKFYYKNDLAYVADPISGSFTQFINIGGYDDPLIALHPFSGIYNSFKDCLDRTVYNLFEVTVVNRKITHPHYIDGSEKTFALNNLSPNDFGSGYNSITLIRGQRYYFDSEVTGYPFIITTDPDGGSFNGQFVNTNVLRTGQKLMGALNTSDYNNYYSNMPNGQALTVGTMVLTPNSSTPDTLYFQSVNQPNMGWRLNIVDENPWNVFSSGAVGQKGEQGIQGAAGLAFVWKGAWSNSTTYHSGQSVYYNGSSWVAKQTVFASPPSEMSTTWELIAKGGVDGAQGEKGDAGLAFIWKGLWSSDVNYNILDSVYYNGSSWVANRNNINVPPNSSPDDWSLIAKEGGKGDQGNPGPAGLAFTWKGDWVSTTAYQSGDSVYYEGSSFGTLEDVSGVAPDAPNSKWEIIAQRGGTIFSWRGDWNEETQYYAGDAVFFSGGSYATHAQSSGLVPTEGGVWFPCALGGNDGSPGAKGEKGDTGSGVTWRGAYSTSGQYRSGDLVYYNGNSYIARSGNISGVLPVYSPPWDLFARKGDAGLAFVWKGTWQTGIQYDIHDSVYFQGSSYGAVSTPTIAVPPTGSEAWDIIASIGATGNTGPMGLTGPRGNAGIVFEFLGEYDYIFDTPGFTGISSGQAVTYWGESWGYTGATPTYNYPSISNKYVLLAGRGDQGDIGYYSSINWRGNYNSGTSYSANYGVTYENPETEKTEYYLYVRNTSQPANTLQAPTGSPYWMNISESFLMNPWEHTFNTKELKIEEEVSETFVSRPISITGIILGTNTNSGSISGYVYRKNPQGAMNQILFNFGISSGSAFYSGAVSGILNKFERVGYSITESYEGASGFALGLFGFLR